MKNNIINIATIAAILVAGAGTAFAAVDESTINTQTATLNFGATQQVLHTLTPVANLPSTIKNHDVVANGDIKTADGSEATLAVRWSDSQGAQQVVNSNHYEANVAGSNDPDNKVSLAIYTSGAGFDPTNATDWMFLSTPAAEYTYVIRADGDQNVPADNYVITLDAGIWNA